MVRCLHIARGEARVMTGLQRVGVLLCGLHMSGDRRKGLEPGVSPVRFGFVLPRMLLHRRTRMGSMLYLVLVIGTADGYCCRRMCHVWLALTDDNRMVFAALLCQGCRNTVTTPRVFGRRATKSDRTNRTSIPGLALVATRSGRLFVVRRWRRLDDLRWHTARLLNEVSVMRWNGVTGLPLTIWWWCVRRSDIQACQILMQTSV
jgi:hypothetical protein